MVVGGDKAVGNTEQIAHWNGVGGERWTRYQEVLDRALEPFGRALLGAARLAPGERSLDVGCGCGWTTLAAAEAVGPSGLVLGVDVSEPMLGLARQRAQARGLSNATFTRADASLHPFDGSFDRLISRFGVMFFADPTAAFANLRTALRPGAHLAFVCWGPVTDNSWFQVPMAAAGAVVALPEPSGPAEPGPFAFADRGRTQRILQGAGFEDVAIDAASPDFVLGPDLETAATYAIETGPVARVLQDHDDATRVRARDAIKIALASYVGPKGVALASLTWVVRARRSA